VVSARRSLFAFGAAWVTACMAGLAVPQIGLFAGLFSSKPLTLPGGVGIEPSPLAVSITLIAFGQYIVLSLLVGRVSLLALMWIPVTTVITVAASTFGAMFWSSSDAIRDLALLQFIFGPPLFPVLIFPLGLAQGILLARLFGGKLTSGLWLSATALAAVIIGAAAGLPGEVGPPEAVVLVDLGLGALYGAFTGAALLAIVSHGMASPARFPV
jgi:hypothetical protein